MLSIPQYTSVTLTVLQYCQVVSNEFMRNGTNTKQLGGKTCGTTARATEGVFCQSQLEKISKQKLKHIIFCDTSMCMYTTEHKMKHYSAKPLSLLHVQVCKQFQAILTHTGCLDLGICDYDNSRTNYFIHDTCKLGDYKHTFHNIIIITQGQDSI